MKLIFRRAKDTSHFVFLETKHGAVYVMPEFPTFLGFLAFVAIIGLGEVEKWWEPWLVISGFLLLLYFVHKFRKPWEGEKLAKIQTTCFFE